MEKILKDILTNTYILIPIFLMVLINTFFNTLYFIDYVTKESNKNKREQVKQIIKEIKENENNNNNTNN